MSLSDAYGNPIATDSAAARDAYDRGVHLFLSAQFGPIAAFETATEADPGFALAHAGLARAHMGAGDINAARTALARAETLAAGITPREADHIRILNLALSGNAPATRAAVFDHADRFPRDVLIVQMNTSVFGLIGFSGCHGREALNLAYINRLLPHYGAEDWWMQSMHALTLCEVGRLDESLTTMEHALSLNPDNANAAHFKSHAQYERGETAAGRAWLQDWVSGYDRRGLLHSHLAWHVALWALHAGDMDAMWHLLDTEIGPDTGHGLPINVLTDSAALLYRAELAGEPVAPDRWAALSQYAATYFAQPGQSFADIHAALAHAMAGDGGMLDRIATTQTGFAADLAAPVAETWGAIARQDWARALHLLTPVMAQTERLGGSRAQRDLLELTYANILMKLGKSDEALRCIATRRPGLAAAIPVHGLH